MILTGLEVLFLKADSDSIVDRLPISSIAFAGQVNLANTTEQEAAKSGWIAKSASTLKRWGSMPSLLSSASAAGDSMEGAAAAAAAPADDGHFAFEIRLVSAGDDGRGRSYFARVGSAEERDAWVAAIFDAVRAEQSSGRSRATVLARAQANPPTPPPLPPPGPAPADHSGAAPRRPAPPYAPRAPRRGRR